MLEPEFSDGCDHDGFRGGCARMGHSIETCPFKPKMDKIHLMGQWEWVDGTVEGFAVNGMLAVPQPDGVVYVTREQAKQFFGLVEPVEG